MELTDSKKVLIIDDSKVVRFAHTVIIANACHIDREMVLTAQDGQEALDVLEANPDIDLIICDLDMPVMTGPEFFQGMRTQPGDPVIPFILSTGGNAERQAEIETLFETHGGNAVFTEKPLTIEKLANAVASLSPRSFDYGQPVPFM